MQQTQYRRRHAMCEMRCREPHDAGWHWGDDGRAGNGCGSGCGWRGNAARDAL